MFSEKDFERLWFLYKTEGCIFRSIPVHIPVAYKA